MVIAPISSNISDLIKFDDWEADYGEVRVSFRSVESVDLGPVSGASG